VTTYLNLWSLIAAYGLCFGLMNDKMWWLTDRLRQLRLRVQQDEQGTESTFFERMFACPFCTGFHAGWVIWLIRAGEAGGLPVPIEGDMGGTLLGVLGNILAVALSGFASAAFCYCVDTTMQRLEASIR